MSEKKPVSTLSWRDHLGREQRRTIKHTLDVRDYLGTPGYSLLVVAANRDLSVSNIGMFLDYVARDDGFPYVVRPSTWIWKRRRLFQAADTDNVRRGISDPDGQTHRALQIMIDNPKLSLRELTALLMEHGIKRGREWVRQYRCIGPD